MRIQDSGSRARNIFGAIPLAAQNKPGRALTGVRLNSFHEACNSTTGHVQNKTPLLLLLAAHFLFVEQHRKKKKKKNRRPNTNEATLFLLLRVTLTQTAGPLSSAQTFPCLTKTDGSHLEQVTALASLPLRYIPQH